MSRTCTKNNPPLLTKKSSWLKSFTLIEIMMTSLILVIALMATLGAYVGALNLAAVNREVDIATDDAKDILEKIDSVGFNSITTEFPDECCIGSDCDNGTGCPGVSNATEFLLRKQKIEIEYPEGVTADTLEIKVTVSWVGKTGRRHKNGGDAPPVVLQTLATRGL